MDPLSPDDSDQPQENLPAPIPEPTEPAPQPPPEDLLPASELTTGDIVVSAPQAAPVAECAAPAMSPSSDFFLQIVGRIVATFVLLLGLASTVLCFYAVYWLIRWLWFTP